MEQAWGRVGAYSRLQIVATPHHGAALSCRQHAWGKDLLLPVSGGSEQWMGLGLTLVDALDTLLLMNLTAEFTEARAWIVAELDPNQVNRVMRGLGLKPEEAKKQQSRGSGSGLGQSENLQKFFATCAPGLEDVLVAELSSPLIGALQIEPGSAGVSFMGTRTTGYKANLWLRTAVRVLVELASGPLSFGRGKFDPVYEFVRDAVDWPSILVADDQPPLEASAGAVQGLSSSLRTS